MKATGALQLFPTLRFAHYTYLFCSFELLPDSLLVDHGVPLLSPFIGTGTVASLCHSNIPAKPKFAVYEIMVEAVGKVCHAKGTPCAAFYLCGLVF